MLKTDITAADLRKLIDGKPDGWKVPISIAYSDDYIDDVYARLDGVDTVRPMEPEGNIHDQIAEGIFITLGLVSGLDEEWKDEDEVGRN